MEVHFCVFQFGDYEEFYRTFISEKLRFPKCFLWERICYFPLYQSGCNEPGTTLCYYCTLGFPRSCRLCEFKSYPFGGWLWFQNVRDTHTHTHFALSFSKVTWLFHLLIFFALQFSSTLPFLWGCYLSSQISMRVSVSFGGLVFCYHKTIKTQTFW